MSLTKRVVDGLIQFNSAGFRESSTYCKRFIKVLLVSLIGRQKLAEKQSDDLAMDFILGEYKISSALHSFLSLTHLLKLIYIDFSPFSDLYKIRKGEAIEQCEFEQMVEAGIQEINENKFN